MLKKHNDELHMGLNSEVSRGTLDLELTPIDLKLDKLPPINLELVPWDLELRFEPFDCKLTKFPELDLESDVELLNLSERERAALELSLKTFGQEI